VRLVSDQIRAGIHGDEAMKVSEWLREYQITGVVPDVDNDRELCFWAGWMIGGKAQTATKLNDQLELAIKAAEFIESHAKG